MSPLASVDTPEWIHQQFLSMSYMGAGFGRHTDAMNAFFKRVTTPACAHMFAGMAKLHGDLQDIALKYLTWLWKDSYGWKYEATLIENLVRLLSAMEINTNFNHENLGRMFVWLDRGERMAAANALPKDIKPIDGKVIEYTGRASKKKKEEPDGPLDNPKATLHIYKYKENVGGIEMEQFYWQLKWDKHALGGKASSLEEGAEYVYKAFYRNMTTLKVNAALIPRNHQVIVLLGNWINGDQLKAAKTKPMIIPDVASDDRDGMMFAMGYENPVKEKVSALPKRVTLNTKVESTNPLDYKVEFESKAVIVSSLDWYVFKPENIIQGEVQCVKCGIIGPAQACGMLHVRGMGLHCMPCVDDMTESGKVDNSMYDME